MRDRVPPSNELHNPPSADPEIYQSSEDLHNHIASPPYKTFASSSNVFLEDLTSPAYLSKASLVHTENETMHHIDEKKRMEDAYSRDANPGTTPKVHYPVDVAPAYQSTPPRQSDSRNNSMDVTDDEDEEDNYDWSGEDDLVDEEAKYEQQMGVKPKTPARGFKRFITLLFSSLIGSTFLSALLVLPAILLQFYWYKPSPTESKHYQLLNVQSWLFWAAANVLLSWYLAVIVDIMPHVAHFVIDASWGDVNEFVKTRLGMYESVKDTIKPLLYAASGWVSWTVIFGHIFQLYNGNQPEKSRAQYTQRIYQVIEFIFFLTLVICAQKMLSKAIAFAFHRTAYADRVSSVRESVRVIDILREYRPKPRHGSGHHSGTRTPIFGIVGTPFSEKEHFNWLSGALKAATPAGGVDRRCEDEDADQGDIEDEEGKVGRKGMKVKGKGKKRNGSGQENPSPSNTLNNTAAMGPSTPSPSRPITPTRTHPQTSNSPHRYPPTVENLSMNTGDTTLVHSAAKALKTAVLHDARNLQGKGDEGIAVLGWNIESAHEAKLLARSIYMKFKDRRRTFLVSSDFHPAFPTPAEAEAAFRVFDKDDNGDISKAEIKTILLKVYKERRSLSRSMRDVSMALKTLDHILLFFAFVILFFISLSVFGVEVGDSLTSVYSIGIAASFIFKNSASGAFDAIMFLFVTHPYDTGDRCLIDEEVLVVKKMGLFATVFTRVDGTETYYFNGQLFSKFITNIRRSGKMFENLTMQVEWRTPLEKLDQLEKCLNEWLATEEHRWFDPSTSIGFQHIDFQRYLTITIGIPHNGTWQDWGLRMQRRTAFHAAVQFYCRQLGIVGYESPIPITYTDTENIPSTPMSLGPDDPDYPTSPTYSVMSPTHAPTGFGQQQATEREEHSMKPIMGFLAPNDKGAILSRGLTRPRRSKGRKAGMRGLGAEG